MYFFVALFLLTTVNAAVPAAAVVDGSAAPVPAASTAATSGDAVSRAATSEDVRRRAGIAAAARARVIAAASRDVLAARREARPSSPRVAFALRALGFAYESDQQWLGAEQAYTDADVADAGGKRWGAAAVDLAFAGRDAFIVHRYSAARDDDTSALALLQHPGDLESPLANECRLALARVYVLEGRWDEAADLVARALRFDTALRPWDEHARGADLVARGEVELGREHYAEALADFERGNDLEAHVSGVRGAPLTPDVAPDLTRALIGLDADSTSLTVAALGDQLMVVREELTSMQTGTPAPPGLDTITLASTRAMIAAGQPSPADVSSVLSRLRAFDSSANTTDAATAEADRALGDARFALHQDAAAADAYLASRLEYERALGSRFPQSGEIDGSLARVALDRGRAHEAIGLLKLALREEASFGLGDGPVAQMNTGLLARAEDADGRIDAAAASYARSLDMIRAVLARSGTFLTERQRLRFLRTASVTVDRYTSFLVARRPHDFAGTLYDVALFGKEIVAGSLASAYSASASDPALESLRVRLARERRLVSERTYGGSDSPIEIYEADLAEADLVAAAEQHKPAAIAPAARWRDVRAALAPHEAAVEYLRVGDAYIALVLTPSSIEPAMVPLGSSAGVAAAVAAYASGVAPGGANDSVSTRSLYTLVWAPLTPALDGATRVYLAADGALDQIAFSILQRSDGKDLIDLVDLRQLTSTKDLLTKSVPPAGKSAVVFADPAFDARIAESEPIPAPDRLEDILARSAPAPGAAGIAVADESRIAVRGGSLRPLPETEDELRDVASMLHDRGWSVEAYRSVSATKPALEAVQHPRVLHVATHGYVLRDVNATDSNKPSEFEDPMQRSMLFLSGAGRTWSKTDPPNSGLDNGILTAYEASSLDLHGTELVVLSACETGLGRVEGGEGVLGLRRAFQQAGAQFVLSTLWQIPSDDTVGLLDLFYKNWLGGENKYDALRDAQRTMRARAIARTGHDDPRAWGAFVLVGNGHG